VWCDESASCADTVAGELAALMGHLGVDRVCKSVIAMGKNTAESMRPHAPTLRVGEVEVAVTYDPVPHACVAVTGAMQRMYATVWCREAELNFKTKDAFREWFDDTFPDTSEVDMHLFIKM